jgi:hypothetical protein
MERGGRSLVQRDLIRNQESEIGVEVLSCNILVFVDIEKPSTSLGFTVHQDSDACKNVYSIDTTIDNSYKGGKLLLHNGHIV